MDIPFDTHCPTCSIYMFAIAGAVETNNLIGLEYYTNSQLEHWRKDHANNGLIEKLRQAFGKIDDE